MISTSVFSNGELTGIYPTDDFHQLTSSQVDKLAASAKLHSYRRPKNAPGSTARMYFQALQRKWRGERRNPREHRKYRRNRRAVRFSAGFKKLMKRVRRKHRGKARYRKNPRPRKQKRAKRKSAPVKKSSRRVARLAAQAMMNRLAVGDTRWM